MNDCRYAIHPDHFKELDSDQLRNAFLVDALFEDDLVCTTYSHFDRLIMGGVKPVTKSLPLPQLDSLKSDFFLQRREIGIINVGGPGKVSVDGNEYSLLYKEALYIGRGTKEVIFQYDKNSNPLYYFNSAPAHAAYPTRKVSLSEAETVEMGSLETSNHRTIRKLLVNSVLPTCQLQMGLTELMKGSVWNTMPPHTHDRRMEAYFYFEVPENQTVSHFMGKPDETRHIWVKNNQAVISPSWSIHCGAGTSNYTFIWGMAGENLDYSDMDTVKPTELK
ncbi:MAG: 5-dehydro-4-deoxy-D-glucuronate isomerase [Bacteroidia bacterium]|nr:5-dehydro-4-deoxy-D-glucuronate isomerase [Bacteroidia bacterium]